MYNLTFIDKYGNTVTNLTQWDTNQDLYIEASIFNKIPQFHFCNKNSEKALVVRAIAEGELLKISIPNILLIEPYPITIYAYINELEEDVKIGKTVEYVQLPVRPRPEPNSFTYENNVEIIDLQEIADEIIVLNEESKLATTRANVAAQACEDLLNTKGVSGGIASLDENGKVPLEQLPDNIGSGGLAATEGYIPFLENGVFTLTKVADDGSIESDTETTGALKITLPLKNAAPLEFDDWEDYLVSFKVDIFENNYDNGKIAEYIFNFRTYREKLTDQEERNYTFQHLVVSPYEYYALESDIKIMNIRFSNDYYVTPVTDDKFAIYLGDSDTKWDGKVVVIKDITYQLFYSARERSEEECYELWSKGWEFSVESEIPDVEPCEIKKLTMPTKTSELENDSEFITASEAKAMPTTSRGAPNRVNYWWRIAEYDCTANPSQITDSPHSCVLTLKYSYSTSNYYKISFYSTGYAHKFNLLEAECFKFENVISKIRFVKDSTKAYLEVYHQSVKPSYGATLSCTVHDGSGAFDFKWKAVTPKQIADEVAGLTVLTTYDLIADARITTNNDLYRFSGSGKSRNISTSFLKNLSSHCSGNSGYHNFYISSSYTGDDLPNDGYKGSYATVYYSDSQPVVVLWGTKTEGSQKIVINRKINSTTWTGWESLITSGEKDVPNGIATLDENGTIPLYQLPSGFGTGDGSGEGGTSLLGLEATVRELNFLKGATSNVQEQIDTKVDKVKGKRLTTNDFTTAYKNKLDNDLTTSVHKQIHELSEPGWYRIAHANIDRTEPISFDASFSFINFIRNPSNNNYPLYTTQKASIKFSSRGGEDLSPNMNYNNFKLSVLESDYGKDQYFNLDALYISKMRVTCVGSYHVYLEVYIEDIEREGITESEFAICSKWNQEKIYYGHLWEIYETPTLATDINYVVLDECDLSKKTDILTTAEKGIANGVATLDENGKIPASQLPDGIGSGGGDDSSSIEGLTATVDELNYLSGVTSNVQEQLNDKIGINDDLVTKMRTKGLKLLKTSTFQRGGQYWFKIAKFTSTGSPLAPFSLYMSASQGAQVEGYNYFYNQEAHVKFSSMGFSPFSSELNKFKMDVICSLYNNDYRHFVSKMRVIQDNNGYAYIEIYSDLEDDSLYPSYTFNLDAYGESNYNQWDFITPEVDSGDNIYTILAECDLSQNVEPLTTANSSPVSVTNVEPTDTKSLWVDTTDMSAIKLKVYNTETSAWVSIN